MVTVAIIAAFIATYATGPAGKDDRAARARRLYFPVARLMAVKVPRDLQDPLQESRQLST